MRLRILSLIFVLLLVTTTIYSGLYYISSKTHTTNLYFPKIVLSAYKQPTILPGINFVILGLDPRNDSLEKTETTDTIMIARLTTDMKINIISIPRDLWVYSLSAKVNQIYPNSLKSKNKYEYIQQEFSKLTGQKIDKTIIITTQSLIKLTKIVGGVDVELTEGFVDNQYPNPAYVNNPTTKTPIYITVQFDKGPVHLDENNIEEFVRSRKSLTGGTDLGRMQRQQLLLEAIVSKIKSPSFYKSPRNIFSLYNFYKSNITTNFQDIDVISLGLKLYPQISQLKLNKNNIPTGENSKTDILYHPAKFINPQWVFIPQDKDYLSFQELIQKSLSL